MNNSNSLNSSSKKYRVAIIGAGVSGILAIKSCKEEENTFFDQIICYEKTSSCAGLWRFRETSSIDHENISTVMYSTISNSSKEMSAFSDYPPEQWMPNYLHHKTMVNYIENYAKQFNCLKHIKYQHEVKRIQKINGNKWKVIVINHNNNQIKEELFDVVMVCSGHHSHPNKPYFIGQENFKGQIIHSQDYKKCSDDYYGKKVLVVGVGNSGIDIAAELSNVCDKVYLSSRRGCWVLPRVGQRKGRPFDYSMLRRSLHDLKDIVPLDWTQIAVETFLRKRFDHELYGLRPSHPLFTEHPTVNDVLPSKILSGTIIIKADVLRFNEFGVVFNEDIKNNMNKQNENQMNVYDIDKVILATGYQLKFPFLDPSFYESIQFNDPLKSSENSLNLYKYIIPIEENVKPTIGFIGIPNAIGPLFPIAEMQSRWFVQLIAGKIDLPSNQMMKFDVEKYHKFRLKNFVNSKRHGVQVEWIPYLDELANQFGAKPNLTKFMFKDPKLFMAIYFGPSVPYQYRLQGPHCWSGARDAILNVNKRIDYPFKSTKAFNQFKKSELSFGQLKLYSEFNLLIRLFVGFVVVFLFELFTNFN